MSFLPNAFHPAPRLLCGTPLLLSLMLLAGCATDSLRDAPESADKPWVPDHFARKQFTGADSSQKAGALKMPPGYSLPGNTHLPQHEALNTPEIPEISATHSYNLAELIDIAQSTNPATRIAWDAARNSALATGITRSAYLPELTATIVGGYNYQKHSRNARTSTAPKTIEGNGEVQSLGMRWLLFDFGKRSALLESARQTSLASNISFTAAHQKLIYSVASAWYLYMATQARLKLVRQSLNNANRIEAATQTRLHHGEGTIIDSSEAEAATAQAKLQLVQTRGDLQNRYLALLTAMGISPTTQIALHQEPETILTPDDIRLTDKMVHDAMARRPDVLAAYASERASESRIRAAKAEFLPKIFTSGNATYGTGHLNLNGLPGIGGGSSSVNVNSSNFSGLILGGITVPVFDGGLRLAQLKMAQDNEDAARAQLQKTEDNSIHEIVEAQNSLHTAIEAHLAAETLRHASQTAFDASLTAYQSGQGNVTHMLEVQNALFRAAITCSDTYYASLVAASALAFATGSLGDSNALPNPLNAHPPAPGFAPAPTAEPEFPE